MGEFSQKSINETILSVRLAMALAARNMTGSALVKRTGITSSTIYAMLDGRQLNPTVWTVFRIARALDVPMEWLCGVDAADLQGDDYA